MDHPATLRSLDAMIVPAGGIVLAGKHGRVWEVSDACQEAVRAARARIGSAAQ